MVLLGMGVVGTALAREVLAEGSRLGGKDGHGIRVVAVADSRSTAVNSRGLDLTAVLRRKSETGLVGETDGSVDNGHLLMETEADMMVMLTSANPKTGEPALSQTVAALENGMDVVTANKMPLALRYRELLDLARRRGRIIRYSACVGGGMPVIEFGELCAMGDDVRRIDGVLNATSNFILSEMERGADFNHAVKKARRLGYAEADPSLDVDGIDAACKMVILGNHVLGRAFRLGDVNPREGIRKVSAVEVKSALRKGKRVRMVASAERGVEVRVTEIPAGDAICVRGTDNAVRFECLHSGPRLIQGPAGGGPATSTAVIRDILAVARLRTGLAR
jgi:homoserine dehydrogenase